MADSIATVPQPNSNGKPKEDNQATKLVKMAMRKYQLGIKALTAKHLRSRTIRHTLPSC